MRLQLLLKKSVILLLGMITVCFKTTTYAETLVFKSGDQTSYVITQTIHGEQKLGSEIIDVESESQLELEVKILSSHSETFSYPIEVELIVKRICLSEIQQDGKSLTIIRYDSAIPVTKENYLLAKNVSQLIECPLHFKITKDFQVEELTGYLKSVSQDFDSPSVCLFGATPWTFEFFLTQLFHLSGETLNQTHDYPVSCYQLVNWEEKDKVDLQKFKIEHKGSYLINELKLNQIEGCWVGKAQVCNEEGDVFYISVEGDITWDKVNSIRQQRDLKIKLEAIEKEKDEDSFTIRLDIQQNWQSKD